MWRLSIAFCRMQFATAMTATGLSTPCQHWNRLRRFKLSSTPVVSCRGRHFSCGYITSAYGLCNHWLLQWTPFGNVLLAFHTHTTYRFANIGSLCWITLHKIRWCRVIIIRRNVEKWLHAWQTWPSLSPVWRNHLCIVIESTECVSVSPVITPALRHCPSFLCDVISLSSVAAVTWILHEHRKHWTAFVAQRDSPIKPVSFAAIIESFRSCRRSCDN